MNTKLRSVPRIWKPCEDCRISWFKFLMSLWSIELAKSFSNTSSGTLLTYLAQDLEISRNSTMIDFTTANSRPPSTSSILSGNNNIIIYTDRNAASNTRIAEGFNFTGKATFLTSLNALENTSLAYVPGDILNEGSDARLELHERPKIMNFSIPLEQCQDLAVFEIFVKQGVVSFTELTENMTFSYESLRCVINITVPDDGLILLSFDNSHPHTCNQVLGMFPYRWWAEFNYKDQLWWSCYYDTYPALAVHGNTVNLQVSYTDAGRRIEYNTPVLSIRFEAKVDFQNLPVVFTSPVSGFVTSFAYDGEICYALNVSAAAELLPPQGHVIMLSFPRFDIGDLDDNVCLTGSMSTALDDTGNDYVSLLEGRNGSFRVVWERCGSHNIETNVFENSLRVHFVSKFKYNPNLGFKAVFSYHKWSEVPTKLRSGLWNCSVSYYSDFKHHLECNLQLECHDGLDEGPHCPFSNLACNGSVAFENLCFTYVTWPEKLSWDQAQIECQNRGGSLVSLASPEKRRAFLQLYEHGKNRRPAYIGARTVIDKVIPKLYKDMWQWQSKVVAYGFNVTYLRVWYNLYRVCAYYDPSISRLFLAVDCEYKGLFNFVCEHEVSTPPSMEQVLFPPPILSLDSFSSPHNVMTITCPEGHVTQNFLSCDVASRCGATSYRKTCKVPGAGTVAMFTCSSAGETIPYTLVCDYRPDCLDESDEDFCVYDIHCTEHSCKNGQCFRTVELCDGVEQCVDKSDEENCLYMKYNTNTPKYKYTFSPPALIYTDSNGTFLQTRLHSFDCPDTHFLCPRSYCMPVFLRCNGVYDCPGKEDELECQSYTCPGFYRCRGSMVCVHSVHLCDGVFHCPQHDDEWMCERAVVCPQECVCQGLAFVCSRPFPAREYPDVRYVDASSSRMTLQSFVNNLYLVFLNLSKCQLDTLKDIPNWPNLQVLDLSDNLFEEVNLDVFLTLKNIQNVSLAGNPISFLVPGNLQVFHPKLYSLDLSRTRLVELDSYVLASFSSLKVLSFSQSPLTTFSPNGFKYLPHLSVLDLRKTLVWTFSLKIFKELAELSSISVSNPRLCCPAVLPEHFDSRSCSAPPDPVSSCNDLLRQPWSRIFLWTFMCFCFLGNSVCLLLRYLMHGDVIRMPCDIFLTNLCIADFLMGVYLALICAADLIFMGNFFFYEHAWRNSVTCKAARFLSVLSLQTSVFYIFFLSLDRFLVLHKISSHIYLQRKSAGIVCGGLWLLAIGIASIAVLLTSLTEDYRSYTNLCLPFLQGIYGYQDYGIFFLVLFIVNLLLLLLASGGQLSVYRSASMALLVSDKSSDSRNKFMARRLFTIVWTNFLSWLSASFASFLNVSNFEVSDDVIVVLAFFVFPLNSALNPIIYIYNVLAEERLRRGEKKIMLWLQSRAPTQKTNLSCSNPSTSDLTTEEALKFLKTNLEQNSVDITVIKKYIYSSCKLSDKK